MSDTPRRVAGLVLAAGGSARLGVPKQLLEFRGEALVCRAARAVAEAGASPVIVVLGARAAEIAHALRAFPSIALVTNERWRDGLASSLAIGLREVQRLAPSSDGVLVTTADQPLVSGAMLRRLVDELTEQSGLVAAKYAGTIGVPAVIGRAYFDALLALEGDAGAGRWLRSMGDAVRHVALEEAAVDIDTVQDAARLESLAGS